MLPIRTAPDEQLRTLALLLSAVFPNEDVSSYCCIIPNSLEELKQYSGYPEEQVCISELQPIRQAEFLAGRHCARRAAGRLSMQLGAILWDARGVPQWPENTIGSISHKGRLCAAAVSSLEQYKSIGLDIETTEYLRAEIWGLYCTRRELIDLRHHSQPNQLVNLIFCIKESVYKCLFPVERIEFEFSDVEVTLEFDQGIGQGKFQAEVNPNCRANFRSEIVQGRFSMHSKWVVAGTIMYPR